MVIGNGSGFSNPSRVAEIMPTNFYHRIYSKNTLSGFLVENGCTITLPITIVMHPIYGVDGFDSRF